MRKLLLIFLIPTLLLARQKTVITHPGAQIPYDPWFTGPGLAPTAVNMKQGHPGIEPFVTVFYNYGDYNDDWKLKKQTTVWTYNYLIDFQFAITKRTGIEVIASIIDTHRNSNFTNTI